MVSRLPQRSFVYLVSVYVLDPNVQPVAPPLIRFDNGVLGIVGNYFAGLFRALSFDFPSHLRSPIEARRSISTKKYPAIIGPPLPAALDRRRIGPTKQKPSDLQLNRSGVSSFSPRQHAMRRSPETLLPVPS